MCKKIVKKHQSYLVLLLALLLCGSVNAKVNNYVGGYAQIGDWSLIPSQSDYSTSFGVAGGLGFLYEMQAGPTYSPTRFLLDVGVGVLPGMTAFLQGTNSTVTLADQEDLQNDEFDYVYELQNRRDRYNDIALQVPLMFGVQHKAFYMLVGVKMYYHLWTKTKSTALLNTYGLYNDYDAFRDMPQYQFFKDRQLTSSVKTTLGTGLDVDLSFEIGGRIGIIQDAVGYDVPKRKIEYRLAAFVDYGLMDMHVKSSNEAVGMKNPRNPDELLPLAGNLNYNVGVTNPVYNTTSMVDNVGMSDIMSTSNFADKVNNLQVGLKFTVLFQLPEQGECVICRDAYRSSTRRSSGSRGMKYEE